MNELSPTAKVVLGFLASRPRTGYELKSAVDKSTRFFWAASYGQIYPELKRLEQAGLVHAADDPHGGRRRTVYEITADGEAALHGWLTGPGPLAMEMRDEGLLKFFFAESLKPDEAVEVVRAKRREHEDRLARLRAMEDYVRELGGFRYRTLRHGIEMQEYVIGWCREQEKELAGAGAERTRR